MDNSAVCSNLNVNTLYIITVRSKKLSSALGLTAERQVLTVYKHVK